MDSPDQDFYKAYKPLHVPHKYDVAASLQDNVVYALAQLEYATAKQVAQKLWQHDPQTELATHQKKAEEVLTHLFDKGLIKGNDEPEQQYNLSKILEQNSGKANPLY